MAKKTTYTATVTENFDIGEERLELVKGEAVTGSKDALDLLLTNGQIVEDE